MTAWHADAAPAVCATGYFSSTGNGIPVGTQSSGQRHLLEGEPSLPSLECTRCEDGRTTPGLGTIGDNETLACTGKCIITIPWLLRPASNAWHVGCCGL